MKPEVFVVKVEKFKMPKSRIDEIYAELPVAKMWDRVIFNENWKKIHEVPETLEAEKKRMLGNFTTVLKCEIICYALQRVALENKSLQEAIIEEIKEFIEQLSLMKPEEITNSNEKFKRQLYRCKHEKELAKKIAESIAQCIADEIGDT